MHAIRRPLLPLLVLLAVALLLPRTGQAWGFDVHRFLVDRALDLLPSELRPFYDRHRAFVVEHSVDPDLWRSAGFTEEPPRHYLDLDAYGPAPFTELPREYDAAVAKFGVETVRKNGLLPWRSAEIYDRLVEAFKGRSFYAREDIKFFSAVIAHYVADAFVPLHAVANHDGQLTGQHGVHARFETDLVLRYRSKLAIRPGAPTPVLKPRDFVFETLIASADLAPALLAADREATRGRTLYDAVYYERFFAAMKPLLERRLAEAITGIASVIVGAWQEAGRPDLLAEPPPVIRKIGPNR